MKLQTLALTSALLIAGVGCEKHQTQRVPTTVETVAAEFRGQPRSTASQVQTLEGKILKVQPSQVSFSMALGFNSSRTGSHEFIYLLVEDA